MFSFSKKPVGLSVSNPLLRSLDRQSVELDLTSTEHSFCKNLALHKKNKVQSELLSSAVKLMAKRKSGSELSSSERLVIKNAIEILRNRLDKPEKSSALESTKEFVRLARANDGCHEDRSLSS